MNEEINLKRNRVERPDKAAFSAFIGIFLLMTGVCFGVWAYWTYGSYRRAADYAEYLRQNPDALSNSKYNQREIIAENQTDADHDRLEAMWVGAVSIILLSSATFLFVRAVKIYRRIERREYEEIDWRALEKPIRPIRVLYRRAFNAAAIIFYIFFGGLTLLIFVNGIKINAVIIGIFNFLILAAVAFLMTKARRKSAKLFDARRRTAFSVERFQRRDSARRRESLRE